MRILWLCNAELPKVSAALGKVPSAFGGWMNTMSAQIVETGHSLTVACRSTETRQGTVDGLKFYTFSLDSMTAVFKQALELTQPDIIHIWGTEFQHTNVLVQICKEKDLIDRCIISIQGLVSIYALHYTEGLPNSTINHYTLRDFIKHDNIRNGKNKFLERGKDEVRALKMVKHVIGRTDWDKACCSQINPNLQYHFCNETLRSVFYSKQWNPETMIRHSIFVSQCSYPIKGFHYVVEAMPYILAEYPDAHVYTTGPDLLQLSGSAKWRITAYQQYLLGQIRKRRLENHITFLGCLDEQTMCAQYLKANVFVSASTVENSPNSVGEAMLVGCPVVTSDVGGVKNMLIHAQEGFVYQTSAPYMLAYYVNKLLEDDALACEFSQHAQAHAKKTHDPSVNYNDLLKIYKEIANA